MDKNKRYTYLNYSKDGYIGSFYENDKPLTNKEVWNILNNQEEEINTLQSLIIDDEDKLEELKKENERYKFAYNELTSYINANFDEYMTQKKLNERIRELEKQNQQLKKGLKRCREWINSDKNDYELTLAFIKSKGYSLKDVLEYEKRLGKGD